MHSSCLSLVQCGYRYAGCKGRRAKEEERPTPKSAAPLPSLSSCCLAANPLGLSRPPV